jgi:hypothetical protein
MRASELQPIINAVPLWSGCWSGGEWGGAVLAYENAPPNKRAWYGMFPQLGAPIGYYFQRTFLILTG